MPMMINHAASVPGFTEGEARLCRANSTCAAAPGHATTPIKQGGSCADESAILPIVQAGPKPKVALGGCWNGSLSLVAAFRTSGRDHLTVLYKDPFDPILVAQAPGRGHHLVDCGPDGDPLPRAYAHQKVAAARRVGFWMRPGLSRVESQDWAFAYKYAN